MAKAAKRETQKKGYHLPSKTWDTDDITLQHLFGISLFKPEELKPRFGSGITLDLAVGSLVSKHNLETDVSGILHVSRPGQATQPLPPTMYNLAWHFGYMQWILDNIADLVRLSKGKIKESNISPRLYRAAWRDSVHEFEMQRVEPLRRALLAQKHPLYLYCVPSISVETELTTGKPLVTEGDRVLCVLPKSVAVAEYYNIPEADIQLLAPQVIWLVKLLCSFRVIRSPQQLIDAVNGWAKYLSSNVLEQVYKSIQEMNPHIISSQSTKALLP